MRNIKTFESFDHREIDEEKESIENFFLDWIDSGRSSGIVLDKEWGTDKYKFYIYFPIPEEYYRDCLQNSSKRDITRQHRGHLLNFLPKQNEDMVLGDFKRELQTYILRCESYGYQIETICLFNGGQIRSIKLGWVLALEITKKKY